MEENEITSNIEYRLSCIEKSIDELKAYFIETIKQQKDIESLTKTTEDLDKRLEVLEKKPSTWIETTISSGISALVGLFLGFIFIKLGLKS